VARRAASTLSAGTCGVILPRVLGTRWVRQATLFLLSALACTGAETPPPQRIVLISVDTLRADHVGCYGAPDARTPNLDTIAAEGVRFAAALSPVPLTLPAHATLLSGRDPHAHGVRHNSIHRVPPGVPLLAGQLAEAGYATAAVVAARVLDRRFGLDRGFARYDDDVAGVAPGPIGFAERSADEVVDAALAWLATAPERFFLWVHLYDPHRPYAPPPGFASSFAARPYDGEIAFVDAEIGRLLGAVRERWGDAGLLVVATSDHGESLGEHGELTHGYSLYDATQRVPLLISGPGIAPGRTIGEPVSLADVAPTILALAGAPPLAGASGRDLGPELRGSPRRADGIYLETLATQLDFGWSPLLAIRTDRWKLVRAPRPELYDLADDPGETRDLAAARPELVAELDAQLERLVAAGSAAPVAVDLDAATRDELHALGYVTGRSTVGEGRLGVVGGTDPKDGRGLLETLAQAQIALHRGAAAEALALFRPLGDGPLVAAQRAAAAIRAGQPEEAERDARTVLEIQPERGDVRLMLAQALLAQGREAEADLELARIAPEERESAAWVALRLAGAATRAGDSAAAIEILERARGRHPDDVSLATALAGLFEASGRLEEALAVREAALRVEPGSAGLQNDVAWTLARLVRDLDRAQALAESASRALPGNPAVLDTLGAVQSARETR
jgi:arylsulfatase A-like enzyme/Tfp pilus assembly protein PilF